MNQGKLEDTLVVAAKDMIEHDGETLAARVADGTNPAAVKRAYKAELTFAGLFAEYIKRHTHSIQAALLIYAKTRKCHQRLQVW